MIMFKIQEYEKKRNVNNFELKVQAEIMKLSQLNLLL